VTFGGVYRLIDFTLSNCINSHCRKVLVLVQYKSLSLTRHIRSAWGILHRDLGEYIDVIPAQKRVGDHWYRGTADAIYQNLYSIEPEHPRHVLVLAGDHIYKMNYRRMVAAHRRAKADVTVAAIEMPLEQAHRFGVLEIDYDGRVMGFEEKPDHPHAMPEKPDTALASMGVYIFNTEMLQEACREDARRMSSHDFGKDIIPRLIHSAKVYAYMFRDENRNVAQYWRDVGTIDSFWEANMDLLRPEPEFDLYDASWPIRTEPPKVPPAKFVSGDDTARFGTAVDSIVSPGCVISGGTVRRSVLSPEVRVNSCAYVDESILLARCVVGRNARVRRSIIEKGVVIPDNAVIGYDSREDGKFFHVTSGGVVVVDSSENLPQRRGMPEARQSRA
jgi:glucose-1-phosphate adenylyltransferase